MCKLSLVILLQMLLTLSSFAANKLTSEQVTKLARTLDHKVLLKLSSQKIAPEKPISDEVFLRRVYLDAVGRIPNYAEAQKFLNDTSTGKRSKLINKLINSKGYNSQMFNYWADILRAKDDFEFVSGIPYLNYLKNAIKKNHSYKQLVKELLEAKGAAYAPGNGATGYYLRDTNMPFDNMANTIRIFLGTQMVCAQCHDHPFDRWTQKDFYQLTAFMSGLNTKKITKTDKYRVISNKDKKAYEPEVQRQARQLTSVLTYGVSGNGSGLIRLPKTYSYDDAKPHQAVKADVPFGPPVTIKTKPIKKSKLKQSLGSEVTEFINSPGKDINSIHSFANWVTSNENARFVKLIANRMWKKAMGIGIIEPVDDMSKNTMGSNPELMQALMDLMIRVDYDLKEFQKVIYHTQTYQRQSPKQELQQGEVHHFQGPLFRRMGAEQVWDSLLTLMKTDVDKTIGNIGKLKHEKIYNLYNKMNKTEIFEQAKILAGKVLAQREGISQDEYKKITGKKIPPILGAHTKLAKVLDKGFARASELRSPAPQGHFLRKFGQSNREDVQNSSKDANITQTLALMNGFTEKNILNNDQSQLNRNFSSADSIKQKIEIAYLSTLTRKPTSRELSVWTHYIEKQKTASLKDLAWVLTNTNEFLFIK